MPRRNNRETYEPLDLTPADILNDRVTQAKDNAQSRRTDWGTPDYRRAESARQERERRARERQHNARVNGGIDWSVCLVPGCGDELVMWGSPIHWEPRKRDHTYALPLCLTHLGVAFNQANYERNNPLMIESVTQAVERRAVKRREIHEDDKRNHAANVTSGHIYFVRLNGLVKVGWSRDVDQRLRAYGPEVEVLAIYEGSRDDETNLHRQLRPVLARGREWYEDGPIVADFVAAILTKHGQPEVYTNWSKPKRIVAGKRYR